MFSPLMSHVYGLLGRVAPVLIAFQPAAHPGGGAPVPSGGGGGGTASGGGGAGGMLNMLMFPLLALFLYFVMLRPMNKQRKEQDALQKGLQKGDKVVTTSGIMATVVDLDEQFVTLAISEKVRDVKFQRDAIARRLDPNASQKVAPVGSPAEAKK